MNMMKKPLMGVVAAAALAFVGAASANVVDDFSDPLLPPGQRITATSGTALNEYAGNPNNIIGGYRDLFIQYSGDGIATSAMQVAGGTMRFSNESGAGSIGKVTWDGLGGSGNDRTTLAYGLNANLINQTGCPIGGCTEFVATVLRADAGFDYQIGVYTDANNYSLLDASTLFSVAAPGVEANYLFEWFQRATGAYSEGGFAFNITHVGTVDFTKANALQLVINTTGIQDVDLQLDMVGKRAVPEPGSLALAGLALLGAGVVRRRMKA